MTSGVRKLIAGTMVFAIVSATVPMGGCEPMSTAIAAITFQQLLVWIAQAAVSWVVVEIAGEIYIEVRNAITGEKGLYKPQPGDVIQFNQDGSYTVR